MDKTLLSIFAGLGGMVGWGTSDFFANISSDKVGHLKTFFWSQLAGIVLTLILIPIFGFNSNITFIFGFFVILASLFYSAGYLLFYKAFEIGNVSIVAASINLYVILSMNYCCNILQTNFNNHSSPRHNSSFNWCNLSFH